MNSYVYKQQADTESLPAVVASTIPSIIQLVPKALLIPQRMAFDKQILPGNGIESRSFCHELTFF